MEEAKGKGDREGGSSLDCCGESRACFAYRHEDNAEGDHGLDDLRREADDIEDDESEGDSGGKREGGDDPHEVPERSRGENKGRHEEHVVVAREDMPDAVVRVFAERWRRLLGLMENERVRGRSGGLGVVRCRGVVEIAAAASGFPGGGEGATAAVLRSISAGCCALSRWVFVSPLV